ncbi:MAG: hypothetical protein HYU31_06450, partial [Deltaproteobacteria bacterium]|nr:hypothetical protein [Deltaproteobacteria bacterium]
MDWVLKIAVILFAGATGGVANAILVDGGFKKGFRETLSNGQQIILLGWKGNVFIGAIAALIFWVTYGNIDMVEDYNVEVNPLKKEVVIITGIYRREKQSILSKFTKGSEFNDLPPQGYLIKFIKFKEKDIILIAGRDIEGLFYGCATFIKLLTFGADAISIKMAEIRDWPDFQRRGIQRYIFTFDKSPDSRYYETGTSNWNDIVDSMHRLKLNTLIIHSECWVGADCIIPVNGVNPKYREIIRETIDY